LKFKEEVVEGPSVNSIGELTLENKYYQDHIDFVDIPAAVIIYDKLKPEVAIPKMPKALCEAGLDFWLRKEIGQLVATTKSPFQLDHYLYKLIIPILGPTDLQIFVRWSAVWITAAFRSVLNGAICPDFYSKTCMMYCNLG
jgi:hypothetical protein